MCHCFSWPYTVTRCLLLLLSLFNLLLELPQRKLSIRVKRDTYVFSRFKIGEKIHCYRRYNNILEDEKVAKNLTI